jgi:hypothetical protein
MTNSPSIAQLQSDWFGFSDLDRARAVLAIKQTGISTRQVAAQLRLSESLLRHLLLALRAPVCDQDLARQGKISTNELVRRVEAGLRQPVKGRETPAIDRDREVRIAADLISDWLLQTKLFVPAREMIVKEVQREFRNMKEAGRHPSAVASPGTLLSQIIERTKPPADHRIDIVAWFAHWLCRWTLFAFPDEDIRDTALVFALQKQSKL